MLQFLRKTIVRLHGYKEELEVPIDELTESLGQQYIMDQIAEAQMEVSKKCRGKHVPRFYYQNKDNLT